MASKKVSKKVAKKKSSASVADFLAALEHPQADLAKKLVTLLRKAPGGLEESIKWNAPSFAVAGDHRFTLNLAAQDRIRLILHCGVKKTKLDMKERLAGLQAASLEWAASDRAVLSFRNEADLKAQEKSLKALLPAWLEACQMEEKD